MIKMENTESIEIKGRDYIPVLGLFSYVTNNLPYLDEFVGSTLLRFDLSKKAKHTAERTGYLILYNSLVLNLLGHTASTGLEKLLK